MKKILFILLMIGIIHSAARAQESPIAISYAVSGMNSDATSTTMNLSVTVVNNGPEAVSQVSLLIPGPTGDETVISGGISFDSIAAGQAATASGVFIAPREYYEGSPLEVLSWKVSYLDAQGQTQSVTILGHKQP